MKIYNLLSEKIKRVMYLRKEKYGKEKDKKLL